MWTFCDVDRRFHRWLCYQWCCYCTYQSYRYDRLPSEWDWNDSDRLSVQHFRRAMWNFEEPFHISHSLSILPPMVDFQLQWNEMVTKRVSKIKMGLKRYNDWVVFALKRPHIHWPIITHTHTQTHMLKHSSDLLLYNYNTYAWHCHHANYFRWIDMDGADCVGWWLYITEFSNGK